MLAAKADVAPEAPGLDFVAAVLQKELQHDHRRLIRHEARQQEHGVAVAARRAREQRQMPRQRGQLEDAARLHELVQQARLANVCLSRCHRGSRVLTCV
jgi:hypothetical protein